MNHAFALPAFVGCQIRGRINAPKTDFERQKVGRPLRTTILQSCLLPGRLPHKVDTLTTVRLTGSDKIDWAYRPLEM